MRPRLVQCPMNGEVAPITKLQQRMHRFGGFLVGEIHQEVLHPAQEPGQGKRALVGIGTNADGIARFTREDAHGFEQHRNTPVFEWVNLAQMPDLRDVLNGGPGNMTGSPRRRVPTRPHRLGQHRRIEIDEDAVVAVCLDSLQMGLGRAIRIGQIILEPHAGLFDDRKKIMQAHRHPVGHFPADDRINALFGVHELLGSGATYW